MKKFIDFNESVEFEPHMMYKDGKEKKANTHDMHLKLKAAGWGHDKEKLSEKDDPCWDSHEMIGMKKKNGKSVPNCVPKESVEEASEGSLVEANLIPQLQSISDNKEAKKIKGVLVDMFTASMITQIYSKVNDANKKKMENLTLEKLVNLAHKIMKKKGMSEESYPLTLMKNLHQSQLPEGFMDTMKQLVPGAKGKPQKLPKGKKTAMEMQFPYARLSVHRMIVALRKARGTAMKGKAQGKDRRENERSLGFILAHVEDIARTRHAEQPNSGRQIHDVGNIDDATQQYFMDKIRQNDWTKADQEILDAMVGNGTDDYTKGGAYHARTLAHDIALSVKYAKKDAGIKESVDEALNMQQRMARGRQMKRNKSKLARGRLKAAKRTASKDVLARRARKAARSAILSKMTKGMSKSDLSPARKKELEKKLEKPAFATKISRVAQKLLPKMRKTEIARRANRNKGSSN